MHSTVAAEEDFFASSTIIITTHPPALSGRRTINIYWAVSFFLSFFLSFLFLVFILQGKKLFLPSFSSLWELVFMPGSS
jgi:hypothetical protein